VTTDPFHDIVAALASHGGTTDHPVRFDAGRQQRTGIPEIILGGSKSLTDLMMAIEASVTATGRAIVTRINRVVADNIAAECRDDYVVAYDDISSILSVRTILFKPPSILGRVGVVAAGTSDRPAAGAVALIGTEMGCEVRTVTDVGVAGLHRLVAPLRTLMAWDPDVLVAVAGMDGALPSVLAGLVPVPVIGLPTSTGYGMGGDGTAALLSMLQSCAPGLTVVNIDNAVGAATTAALIANRAAQYRADGVRT
jgi:NCAIR mutase (PurE)-related protein